MAALRQILLAAVFAAASAPALAEESAPRAITLPDALALSAKSPAHAAAARRAEAARADLRASRSLSPAVADVETSRKTARLTATLNLPLPLFSLGATVATARAELAAAEAERGSTDLDLSRRVERAWLELARAEARAALASDTSARESGLADSIRKRFEAGDAPRADLVAARAVSARAKADAEAAAIGVAVASSTLASLLALDADAPLHAEGGLPKVADPPPLASLRGRAARHPDLLAAGARADAASARRVEASRARLPRLAAIGEYDRDDPTLPGDDYKGGVELELPLFAGAGASARAARLRSEAARADADAEARALDGELVAAYRRLQAALALSRAEETDVVPAAAESADLARKAYAAGQGDLTAVLQAERALAEAQTGLADAQADAAAARADLEFAAGGPW